MSLKGKTDAFGRTDIFAGGGQRFTMDPSTIRLISDRVLIRDDADAEKEGSIIIPEKYRESATGKYRSGVVVAVGPGDRFYEMGIIESTDGLSPQVRRKLITKKCPDCNGVGNTGQFDIRQYRMEPCPNCNPDDLPFSKEFFAMIGRVPICVPPQCKVGERVLYERHRQCEVFINGQRHIIVHAEQAVVAVIEPSDAEDGL